MRRLSCENSYCISFYYELIPNEGTDLMKKYKMKIDYEENCIHLTKQNETRKIKLH